MEKKKKACSNNNTQNYSPCISCLLYVVHQNANKEEDRWFGGAITNLKPFQKISISISILFGINSTKGHKNFNSSFG